MSRCPKKCPSGQLRPLMPRAVVSSVRLADCDPPRCSCHSVQVCTRDTCADSASCLLSSLGAGSEFCPHGLAPADKEDTGPCRDPPPPPCPICAQHLADAPSIELDRAAKPYQPAMQAYNQPAQAPEYHNSFQSTIQPMPYNQTSQNPAYGAPFQPQMQPYNESIQNPGCGAPFQPQIQPCNEPIQNPGCGVPFQSQMQPYNEPIQNPGRGAPFQPQMQPYNEPIQNPGCGVPFQPQMQPYNQPIQNPGGGASFQPPMRPAPIYNQSVQTSVSSSDQAKQNPVYCAPPTPMPTKEDQSTNTSAASSYCSVTCGTMKNKSATNVDNDQPKCKSSIRRKPEEDSDQKSGCCKSGSGSGIHTGPHMGPGASQRRERSESDDGCSGGKRRPSLVHIQKGQKRRLSLQEPLDKNSKKNDSGTTECGRGASLFPTPTTPCMCRMPPAFAGVCTGNLSGTCTCVECNKR